VPPVTLTPDPGLDALLPDHWAARVTVTTPSGESVRRVTDALGSPARPLAEKTVIKKFHTLTASRLTDWPAHCLSLDDLPNVTALTGRTLPDAPESQNTPRSPKTAGRHPG
jgi:2-methylcitrate dehydratase PrpD